MTTGPATGRKGARAAVVAYLRHVTADDLPKIAASLTFFLTLSFAPARRQNAAPSAPILTHEV